MNVYARTSEGAALRRQAARDAIDITARGSYAVNGCRVDLPHRQGRSFSDVEIIDASRASTANDADPALGPTYTLSELDSFEAARSLLTDTENAAVHNFANAFVPGGGFLEGATAQEECLCRESTLYASIASAEAQPLYCRNQQCSAEHHCDAMLFSPSVAVFRDSQLNYLEEPFALSVFTLAAPDLRGRLRWSDPDITVAVMKNRLRAMFSAAAERGITDIVLGAWGCGAFLHDPATVASLTREVLVSEGWERRFRNIIFAVKPAGRPENVAAFRQTFADKLHRSVGVTTQD